MEKHYKDTPEPGTGYVWANIFLIIFLLLHHVGIMLLLHPPIIVNVIITFLFGGVYVYIILIIHAAYRTCYTITDSLLELRCGSKMQESIPLESISDVKKVKGPARIMGKGPGNKGYCNRFSDSVSFVVDSTTVYCSPSNCDEFMEKISCGNGSGDGE